MKRLLLALLASAIMESATAQLPQSWEGVWAGMLQTSNGSAVSTRLTIEKKGDSHWNWFLQYGSQATRPYQMIFTSPQSCYLDEGQNIQLQCYFVPSLSTLMMQYGVGTDRLTTSYVLENARTLRMETASFLQTPIDATASVLSFVLKSLQTARLEKLP